MKKRKVEVDLFHLEWHEIKKGTDLILLNLLKPFVGFNKINILDIKNEVLYIKTEEYAFNHWFITKKEYGSDYLLYDNLYWHGIGETDNY